MLLQQFNQQIQKTEIKLFINKANAQFLIDKNIMEEEINMFKSLSSQQLSILEYPQSNLLTSDDFNMYTKDSNQSSRQQNILNEYLNFQTNIKFQQNKQLLNDRTELMYFIENLFQKYKQHFLNQLNQNEIKISNLKDIINKQQFQLKQNQKQLLALKNTIFSNYSLYGNALETIQRNSTTFRNYYQQSQQYVIKRINDLDMKMKVLNETLNQDKNIWHIANEIKSTTYKLVQNIFINTAQLKINFFYETKSLENKLVKLQNRIQQVEILRFQQKKVKINEQSFLQNLKQILKNIMEINSFDQNAESEQQNFQFTLSEASHFIKRNNKKINEPIQQQMHSNNEASNITINQGKDIEYQNTFDNTLTFKQNDGSTMNKSKLFLSIMNKTRNSQDQSQSNDQLINQINTILEKQNHQLLSDIEKLYDVYAEYKQETDNRIIELNNIIASMNISNAKTLLNNQSAQSLLSFQPYRVYENLRVLREVNEQQDKLSEERALRQRQVIKKLQKKICKLQKQKHQLIQESQKYLNAYTNQSQKYQQMLQKISKENNKLYKDKEQIYRSYINLDKQIKSQQLISVSSQLFKKNKQPALPNKFEIPMPKSAKYIMKSFTMTNIQDLDNQFQQFQSIFQLRQYFQKQGFQLPIACCFDSTGYLQNWQTKKYIMNHKQRLIKFQKDQLSMALKINLIYLK